jgi:hypothetical protein
VHKLQGKAHWLVLAAVAGVGLALSGCHTGAGTGGGFTTDGGGGGGGGTTPNLVLFAEDQAPGDVLSFELTLSSITMSTSGGSPVTVLPSAEAVALEWRHLGVAPTVIQTANIAAGTYTTMTVTVVSPRATVFDPMDGSFPAMNLAACSGASFSVDIPINVTISSSTLTGLRLDLNLRDSIELDAMNNLCLRPLFDVVPTSFTPGQLPGDFDGVLGTVSNLSVTSNRFDFTVFASNELVTVTTDTNTNFEGLTSLSSLANGERLLVDAQLQSSGLFLAQDIIRETTSTTAQQLRGMVLERTPDLGMGDLTSLNLLVMDVIPAPTTGAQEPGEIVTVTVDAMTTFRISTEDLTVAVFPNLDFDRQSLQIGQFVHVVQRNGAMGFTAASITLEEISLTGTVGAGVQNSGFDFVPDGDFFTMNGLGMITASTTPETEFENMPAGTGSLVPNISIVEVRGVLVFDAGSGELVLKRVRLLGP